MQALAQKAINLILPTRCLKCKQRTDSPGSLCASCWSDMDFIQAPYCSCCGFPFEHSFGEDASAESLCGPCAKEQPLYHKARAALVYNDNTKGMILSFKHGDRLDLAPLLGKWLQMTAGDLLGSADLVVSVPLHWRRLFMRQYNQAAVLANLLNHPNTNHIWLKRAQSTPPQGRRNRQARVENVRSAFDISDDHKHQFTGKAVLLVDDVMTTGATINACTKVLLKAGASRVNVLTLARVVIPQ
ncbi:MAG: double zinc ribbon domain-containing protein [Alphaproteobacteria bacterium]